MCKNTIRQKTLVGRLKFWILGLLFLILIILFAVPNVTSHPHIVSTKALTCTKLRYIVPTLKMFKLDNRVYPSTKEGLEALIKNPNLQKYPNYGNDSYTESLPLDSWKKPIVYIHYKTDKGDAFQLISFGADGKYGGEDEDSDIVYPSCEK